LNCIQGTEVLFFSGNNGAGERSKVVLSILLATRGYGKEKNRTRSELKNLEVSSGKKIKKWKRIHNLLSFL
jgi:hypothetical protein